MCVCVCERVRVFVLVVVLVVVHISTIVIHFDPLAKFWMIIHYKFLVHSRLNLLIFRIN